MPSECAGLRRLSNRRLHWRTVGLSERLIEHTFDPGPDNG